MQQFAVLLFLDGINCKVHKITITDYNIIFPSSIQIPQHIVSTMLKIKLLEVSGAAVFLKALSVHSRLDVLST